MSIHQTNGDPADPRGVHGSTELSTADAGTPGPGVRRVLLKLSGEVFGGGSIGIDPDVVNAIARQVAEAVREGAQVAIVVGGGNFFRGAELSQRGMERSRADYIGMLGTVMNSLALQDFIEKQASTPGCSRPSPWGRSPSRTSPGAPSGTSRRAAS